MPNHEGELDRVFAALGNETRRAMVVRLIESPASVRDLAAPFAMSLPSVLQHLQVLQDCGLVTTRKTGRVRTCAIEPDGLRRAESWLEAQRTAWEQRLDALGTILND